jgi:hypothetical protein
LAAATTCSGVKPTMCLGYGKNRPKKLTDSGLELVLKKRKTEEKKGDVRDRQ